MSAPSGNPSAKAGFYTHKPYSTPSTVPTPQSGGPDPETDRRTITPPTGATLLPVSQQSNVAPSHTVSTRSIPTDSNYVGVGGDFGRGISSSGDVNLASSGIMSQQQVQQQFSFGRGSGTTTPQSLEDQHPAAQRRPRGGSMHSTSGGSAAHRPAPGPPIAIDPYDLNSPLYPQHPPQAFTQSVTTSGASSQSASPVSAPIRGRSPVGMVSDSPYDPPLRGGSGVRRGAPRYRACSPPQNAVHIALLKHELEYYPIPAPTPLQPTEDELVQSTGYNPSTGFSQGVQVPIPSRGRSPQPAAIGEVVSTPAFSPFGPQTPPAVPRVTDSPNPKASPKGKHEVFIGQVKFEISPDVMATIIGVITQGAASPKRIFPRGQGCFLAAFENEEQCNLLRDYTDRVLFDEAGYWVARRDDQKEALAEYCSGLKDQAKLKLPKGPVRFRSDKPRRDRDRNADDEE